MSTVLPSSHKQFLRACINHGSLPTGKAESILSSICESFGEPQPTDLKDVIEKINQRIGQYNQKLAFYKHPLADGAEFLVFALTFESEVCKLQMHLSDADRHFFMKMIENTVSKEEFGMPWMDVYSIVDAKAASEKKLTKQRMKELVQIWIMQGYFLEKDHILYLGPRMLVEYGTHLKRNYSGFVVDCPLCKTLVLWDIKCSECRVKIHRECIRKYLIRKSNCPSCNKTWNTRLSLSQ